MVKSNINELKDFFGKLEENISSSQEEITRIKDYPKIRSSEEEAKLDYIAEKTDNGFVLDKEKIEKIEKETDEAVNQFIDQKMKDVSEKIFKDLD